MQTYDTRTRTSFTTLHVPTFVQKRRSCAEKVRIAPREKFIARKEEFRTIRPSESRRQKVGGRLTSHFRTKREYKVGKSPVFVRKWELRLSELPEI